MRTIKTAWRALVCALFVFYPNLSPAQTNKTILYAGDSLMPYISGSLGKRMTGGLGVHVIGRVLDELKLPMTTLVTPSVRINGMAERGQLDLIFPAMKSASNARYFQFSRPVYRTRGVILFASDRTRPIHLGAGGDAPPLVAGLMKGYEPSEAFEVDAYKYEIKTVKVDSVASLFRLIRLGRIDFTVMDELAARHLLANNANWERWIKIGDEIVYDIHISIGVARSSPLTEKLSQINHIIERLARSGEFKKDLLLP